MEYTMTEPVDAAGINQTDYLKLFMQQLSYQDPLQPVDNREFMAQMAQFSALQEARGTNENLVALLSISSGNQSLALLGKNVKLATGAEGTVIKVQFIKDEPPQLVVQSKEKANIPNVLISDIIEVEGA
jgi:flagellar basal-body rod modification protein FlgD